MHSVCSIPWNRNSAESRILNDDGDYGDDDDVDKDNKVNDDKDNRKKDKQDKNDQNDLNVVISYLPYEEEKIIVGKIRAFR